MTLQSPFALPTLTTKQRAKMLCHALQALQAQQQMTTCHGRSILHYTLRKARQHIKMQHYPKGDRIDYKTGAQYFYHCRRENPRTEEHGHFHCFMRYKQIPKRLKPTPLPDWDANIDSPMAHIIAIAMNRCGQPIRRFTVNRWISSDIWYDARHVARFAREFRFTRQADPYWHVLDLWVEGMLHLFAPQIAWLNTARDTSIACWQQRHPTTNAYEDHRLEELSSMPIDFNRQIRWIVNDEAQTVSRIRQPPL
jgi:hypothetical protein